MRIVIFLSFLFLSLFVSSQSERVAEISDLIKKEYAYEVNVDSILKPLLSQGLEDTAIIHRLLSHLDPHSRYLDAKDYSLFKSDVGGSFFGIGVVFSVVDDTILISQVFDNGPAIKAGIKVGDKIVEVNGHNISKEQMSIDDVIDNVRGIKGTTVDFKIIRYNSQPVYLKIVRDEITFSSVRSYYMIDDKTGYIKFTLFNSTTYDDVHNAVLELKKQGMEKLILDLRDNSGGLMREALNIADEFIPSKELLVYTIGHDNKREDYYSKKRGAFETGEIVLLVNEASASSAEILAGALQDNHRVTVIGNRSYGKGLVQKIFIIQDSTALILTTSRYFTPSGRCIQRSYEYGNDTYYKEYIAILNNNGVLPDSLTNKREINWGIIPDMFVMADTLPENELFRQLYYRNYLSQYALEYFAHHISMIEQSASVKELKDNFTLTDELFEELLKLIAEKEEGNKLYYNHLNYTPEDIQKIRGHLETAITAYLAQIKWGDQAFYEVFNSVDDEILFSMSVLND